KQGNRIVVAFAGTNMHSKNDTLNDVAIFNPLNHIPSQFGDAERLYNQVKSKYPSANIEFTGYSLGGSIANLMSHRTGLPSNALAPVGSEHIAKAYPLYFPYKGENITTYGRKGDLFFSSSLKSNKQSGNIVVLPDLKSYERGAHPTALENHYLHNFQPNQIYQSKPSEKKQNINLPFTPTRGVGGVNNNGKPLGFAADIDINQLAQQLGLQSFNTEVPKQVQPQQNSGLFGYKNPLTGSNHIYTREEVGVMSSDEFAKHEKEIDAQTRAFKGTMPTNGDLQREAMTGGGVVYVNSYTRSDGTEVKGYYRSKPRF
ncbi:hypothetical protein IJZ97_01315, partial [bacterium]|nr:hypothetical protein [bacterium]